MEIIENCSSGVKIDIVLLCFSGTTVGCAVRKLLTKGLQSLVLHTQALLIEQLVCHK